MYYDVIVTENPAYERIVRLLLNIINFVASYQQVTHCSLLWCNTNERCCLLKVVTLSGTALKWLLKLKWLH